MSSTIGLPPRAGVGFKPAHLGEILAGADVGFFEVHAENHMGAGGPPHAQLAAIAERWPVSIHGVGLSIGGEGPLDPDHLARLAAVCERYHPASFSEHLAWSSHGEAFLNDLLPLPYSNATLRRVCEHVDRVQTVLRRPMLLENPSTYVLFAESTIDEVDFLTEVATRTGCGLLLDVNNVFVSATNHGLSPEEYLARFPLGRVGEIHLAGHASFDDGASAPLLVDSHDRPVADVVWALYEAVIHRLGPVPTLIEWDNDIPAWPVLAAEAARADAVMARVRPAARAA